MQVLQLDVGGVPRDWLTIQAAVEIIAKNKVVWSTGSELATYRGGYNVEGVRSQITTPSIIAVSGVELSKQKRRSKVLLTNAALFARDHNMCAYCGERFGAKKLSRDHVFPVSRGGKNVWTNVVTACIPCNTKKDNKTPEEAGMKLLFVPYEPNHWENLILKNRNILQDQMEYLMTKVNPEFIKRLEISKKAQ